MTPPDRPKRIAALFAQYRGRVGRFLRAKSVGVAEIPDLTQEVFLRLLRAPDSEDIRNPEAYLFTIARNLTHEHHQKRSQEPLQLDITQGLLANELVAPDDPAETIESQQRLANFEKALSRMKPRVALAFVLHRLRGAKISEISAQMGLAEITIKKYLAEGVRELRAFESRQGREEP